LSQILNQSIKGNWARMKWLLGLSILALGVSARPDVTKELQKNTARAFSLFSVVTFKNEECTTKMDTTMNGICQSADDCSTSKGTASGNCASGFGVCCFHSTEVCSGTVTISNNVTYIQSTNYPSTITTTAAKACTYDVKGASNICQVRLDFDHAVFHAPSTGTCTTDKFTVTSPSGTNPPVICGTNTGNHMYVDTGRNTAKAATIAIALAISTTARSWKIKVRMLECDSMSLAPSGCLQYFTGVGGKFTSFNNPTSSPQIFKNQQYTVCMRQEMGFCTMQVSQTSTSTSPDTFLVGVDKSPDQALVATNCLLQFLSIDDKRYCGDILSANDGDRQVGVVTDTKVPFEVGVFADSTTHLASSVFSLTYRQIPC